MKRYLLSLFVLLLAMASCRSKPEATPESTPAVELLAVSTSAPAQPDSADSTPAISPTEVPAPIPPRFEPAECQFSPSNISNVKCGYVTVPEDRSQVDGPTIRLHVAVASSYDSQPELDPLIYLSGGPGSFALQWLFWNVRDYSDVLKKRDVVFFDPRGVGFSEPSLDCPEVMETFHEILDQPLSNEEWVESILGANLTCRDRLEEVGIDLSAYNSSAMAADVNDIRQALGYDVVNLFGVSYGTRTALTIMRDYPEIVRSAILDSPVPLEVDILGANATSSDDARNLLFERCAEDPICDAAFPDLQGAFDQLAEQLEANSITIPVTHLATNETYDVWVDSGILGASIIEALYNSETIVYVPKMIYDTLGGEEGSYDALATSLEIYLFYGDYSSEAMRNSILCSDEATFSTLESELEVAEASHPVIADYMNRDLELTFRICDVWGAKEADPVENQPVTSDIPTLVLSGEFDPVTPPAWGKQVVESLDNAFYVEFPNLGHFVFAERRCARDIVRDFLSDPTTAPDSNCTKFISLNFIPF